MLGSVLLTHLHFKVHVPWSGVSGFQHATGDNAWSGVSGFHQSAVANGTGG
jgi:hypothetical protein